MLNTGNILMINPYGKITNCYSYYKSTRTCVSKVSDYFAERKKEIEFILEKYVPLPSFIQKIGFSDKNSSLVHFG